MPPSPPLRGHININQETREFHRELLEMSDQLSASTTASGGMGAAPGGIFLLNGAAISWNSKKQPYMSPAANIDEESETAQGAEMKTAHGGAEVKTAHGGAAVNMADSAAAEDKTETPSAKAPARTAARRSRDFLEEGSLDMKNTSTDHASQGSVGIIVKHQLRPLRRDDYQFRRLKHRHQQDHVDSRTSSVRGLSTAPWTNESLERVRGGYQEGA